MPRRYKSNQFIAEGVAAVVLSALRTQRKTPAEAKFAVQGFGPLGQAVSARLASEGLTLLAVSDATGVAYRSDGLILGDITAQVAVKGFVWIRRRLTASPMPRCSETDADVLVLASGPNEIHGNNWNTVAAPLIVEAEWNAVTSTAKERLAAKGVTVIPGWWRLPERYWGHISSRARRAVRRQRCEVAGKTGDWVQQVFQEVSACGAANDHNLDFAARQLAVERVAECLRLCR